MDSGQWRALREQKCLGMEATPAYPSRWTLTTCPPYLLAAVCVSYLGLGELRGIRSSEWNDTL